MSESANTEQVSKQFRPLNVEERIRLNQLEVTIGKTLHSFLTCARALVEIRERQLWREKYRSFGDYAKLRWGIARSTADQFVRSAKTAELLLSTTGQVDGETPLSPDVAEVTLRSLSGLPAGLQPQTWRLAAKVAPPGQAPSHTVVGKVVRMVRDACEARPILNGEKEHQAQAVPDRQLMFVRPIQRLSHVTNFDPQIATMHVRTRTQASRIIEACKCVRERCHQIEERLEARFT